MFKEIIIEGALFLVTMLYLVKTSVKAVRLEKFSRRLAEESEFRPDEDLGRQLNTKFSRQNAFRQDDGLAIILPSATYNVVRPLVVSAVLTVLIAVNHFDGITQVGLGKYYSIDKLMASQVATVAILFVMWMLLVLIYHTSMRMAEKARAEAIAIQRIKAGFKVHFLQNYTFAERFSYVAESLKSATSTEKKTANR